MTARRPEWDTPRDRIEQAIARGWTLDRIVERLRVKPQQVDAVIRAMDEAAAEGIPLRLLAKRRGAA